MDEFSLPFISTTIKGRITYSSLEFVVEMPRSSGPSTTHTPHSPGGYPVRREGRSRDKRSYVNQIFSI